MRGFLSCIQKDVKTFGRSKFSALVAVIVPLLIALLVSSTFSLNELQGVKVGVYSNSYNDLTNSILSGFEGMSYVVVREDSAENCINSVRNGKNQICVVFPRDLSSEGNADSVVFNVDSSRMNIAYALIDEVKTQVGVKSSEISLDLVEDLISKINLAKEDLNLSRNDLNSAGDDISYIEQSANIISSSVPETGSLTTTLNDIKTIANTLNSSSGDISGLKVELDKAVSEVENITNAYETLSGGIVALEAESNDARNKLNDISLRLEGIKENLSSVKVSEAEKIVFPIKTEINSVIDESKNWNYIFPTLLALMILFASTVLASVMALREKQTKAFFRNFITPTSDFTFIMAMYVSSLLILLVQSLVLFSGLILATDLPILDVLGSVSLVLFVSATTFIFLGIFIGHFFRSEEVVILVSLSVVSLMMFFSNTIVPIESILGQYQKFVAFNPLVVASSLLKRIILFDASLGQLWFGFLVLGITFIIFFILAFAARKATKRFV